MIGDWIREEWIRRHRAFLDAIQPFLKWKLDIYARTLPSMVIYDSGRFEMDYHFSEDQKRTLAYADEAIEYIARSVLWRNYDVVETSRGASPLCAALKRPTSPIVRHPL